MSTQKDHNTQVVSFDHVEWVNDELVLHYSLDHAVPYRMRIRIEGVTDGSHDRREMLTMARFLGLTLFPQVFCPWLPCKRLELNAVGLSPADVQLWRSIYRHMLGEYFARSETKPRIPTMLAKGPPLVPIDGDTRKRAILQNGGGKDTVVAHDIVRAIGLPFSWFSVTPATCHEQIVKLSGNQKHHRCNYTYDLPDGTSRSGTGHWFAVGILAAWATDSRYVLVANERSANFGNLKFRGISVNHQFIKSFEFERQLADFVRRRVHRNIDYTSILRPLSELQIARLFALRGSAYHRVFRSCNMNVAKDRSWCGNCAKCASVFLTLALFIPVSRLEEIVSSNMLDATRHVQLFRELCGLEGHKPFECVPHVDECLWAMYQLVRRGVKAKVVSALAEEVTARVTRRGTVQFYAWERELSSEHQLPGRWFKIIEKTLKQTEHAL